MIHSFEIPSSEARLFKQFMTNSSLAETDYKISNYSNASYTLVLFRNRLDCEFTEMSWHMLKDELRRNNVAFAA